MKLCKMSPTGLLLTMGALVLMTDGAPPNYCHSSDLPKGLVQGQPFNAATGTTLEVTCSTKYVEGHSLITCRNGRWSDPELNCKVVDCQLPYIPIRANFKMTCRTLNCTATYGCNEEGFWYNGTKIRVCQRNETWSGTAGDCEAVLCPELPTPTRGRILPHNRTFLAELQVECDRGYMNSGSTRKECLSNNTWSGQTGSCKEIICPLLPDTPHGYVHQREKSTLSTIARITCDEGYIYNKPEYSTRTCQHNMTWTGEQGSCEDVRCPQLPVPLNGKIHQKGSSYKATAIVVCEEGYIYSSPNSIQRQCQGDNTWSGEEGFCERRTCLEIGEIKHGIISASGGLFGDRVELQCQVGYSLDGPSTIQCQADGRWSSQFGQCKGKGSVAGPLSAIIVLVIILIAVTVCALLYFWYRRTTMLIRNSRHTDELSEQSKPLLGRTEGNVCNDGQKLFHCSAYLNEAFTDEYSEAGSPDYHLFQDNIKKEIENVISPSQLSRQPQVSITHLCKLTSAVFFNVEIQDFFTKEAFVVLIEKIAIPSVKSDEKMYSVRERSICFREEIEQMLAVSAYKRKHRPDKEGDNCIDLGNQYVSRKLLLNETIDTQEGVELEPTSQRVMPEKGRRVFQDEDLIRNRDLEKYIVIYGCGGIGKSTLLQRLFWKLANGKWATKFKAIFLINIHDLVTTTARVGLAKLLTLYAVYNDDRDVSIDIEWLRDNQDKIAIFLDGINEIEDFKKCWHKRNSMSNIPDTAEPLQWCIAVMKREILDKSTIIVTSRPFGDLQLIGRHQDDSDHFQLLELVGLTQDDVIDFVQKHAVDNGRILLKATMEKCPMLRSLSSIPFFCAALCSVLVTEDWAIRGLRTYTQITEYIISMFIKRSTRKRECVQSFSSAVACLSRFAAERLLKQCDGLEFDNRDKSSGELNDMRTTGLVMDTLTGDPKGSEQQFVHPSIQDFLAMRGLLAEDDGNIKNVLKQLFSSQRFDTALLFLYGLAFDERIVSSSVSLGLGQMKKTREALVGMISDVSNKVQSMRICHESQSALIAQEVGKQHFEKGVSITDVKLTVIDIMAMIFMLKHHTSGHTISLQFTDINIMSVKEITQFLKDDSNISTLRLFDNNVDDECVDELMKGITDNTSLNGLHLRSDHITDAGVKTLHAALRKHKTLQTLHLESPLVTDDGVRTLGDTLKDNTTLLTLSLRSERITDTGVVQLTKDLLENTTLKDLRLYGLYMDDEGVQAILKLLDIKQYLKITIYQPKCSEHLLDEVKNHKRISC